MFITVPKIAASATRPSAWRLKNIIPTRRRGRGQRTVALTVALTVAIAVAVEIATKLGKINDLNGTGNFSENSHVVVVLLNF